MKDLAGGPTYCGKSTDKAYSNADDAEACVDVDGLAGDARREVGEEVYGRLADFVAVDVAPEGGFLFDVRKHFIDPPYRHGGEGADRAGGEGVDANFFLAEFEGEITGGRFEGGLGDAHDVVAG